MTPLGKSVTHELRAAKGVVGIASIVDFRYLPQACEALVTNALFYVCKTPEMEAARARVFEKATGLSNEIRTLGVHPEGTSPAVDQARAEALAAFETLIDTIREAEVTPVGRALGVG